MAEVRGFEEHGDEVPHVCLTCDGPRPWPGYYQCVGCLVAGVKPADTSTFRTVHWDTAVLHAVIRRKVAQWEQACPGWELVPDMQRYWEDATHPSKYVDRETRIGRKLAWTRFRVERRHPRGRRRMGQVVQRWNGPMTEEERLVQECLLQQRAAAQRGQERVAGGGGATEAGGVIVLPRSSWDACYRRPEEQRDE